MALLSKHCPIRWQALHNGQAIALQSDHQQLTYSQLDKQLINLSEQISTQISLYNAILPIRLVCIAPNSIELLKMQLLCIRMGWLFCPLNPRFTEDEIKQRLSILNSNYCWVSQKINDASTHHHFNTLQIDFTQQYQRINKPLLPLLITPTAPCSIIFTSGSSGFPKAIVHHYQQHFLSALGSQKLIPLETHDHNLLSLPLFHVGGYATVIRTIIAGACIHLTHSPLDLSLLQQRSITHLSLVSTQLIHLLSDPNFTAANCAIKHILLGGSAFPDHLLSALGARNFAYHMSYGCTEMASQVATSSNDSALQVLPYRQVKIQDGEILLRGDTRCIGYFEDNKITEIDTEEWIKIGDTGTLMASNLHVSGRKDRQFISGGENIKPEEIERTCLQHHDVKQVFIAPINDKKYGNRIALFVAFDDQGEGTFDMKVKQLKQYLTLKLTRFKQPDVYLAWPKPTNNQALKVPKQRFQSILKEKGLIF